MPKYFMSGTKYESFERMMMTPPTHIRSDDTFKENEGSDKRPNTEGGGAERNEVSSNPQ